MRIWIRGISCSGKTTLAKRISKELQIRHIELDQYHWLPNWKERETQEFAELVGKEISSKHWVIDGNYSKIHKHLNIEHDLIIWMDYSLLRLLYRCAQRTFRRIIFKEEVCNGNRESLKSLFSRDNLFFWIFKTYRRRKMDLNKLLNENEKIVIIRSEKDLSQLITDLKSW